MSCKTGGTHFSACECREEHFKNLEEKLKETEGLLIRIAASAHRGTFAGAKEALAKCLAYAKEALIVLKGEEPL